MFTHLHLHTLYSLLDANIRIEDLMQKVKDLGQTSVAITDHGNMYGSVEFYKTAKEYGIKPIIGCECYICEDDASILSMSNNMYHIVLLAKNELGRQNLQKLVKESTTYKFNKRFRIDFSMLKKYSEGLICLSACMAGQVSRALMDGHFEEAVNLARQYQSVFKDDYYIEFQAHTSNEQQILNKKLIKVATAIGAKYVVTCDSHYLNQEDQKYHSMFVRIGSSREAGEIYDDCYVQSEDEVRQKCIGLDEKIINTAIANTQEIVSKCNVEYPLSAPIIPHTTIPQQYKNEEAYLKALCNKGFKEKGFLTWDLKQWKEYMTETIHNADGTVEVREFVHFDTVEQIVKMYKARAKYEMDSVLKMGFEGYYLLVHSYISSARRKGIARGSAGGSLLAYLCGIVDIDPIKYGLYFERFIDVGALDLLDSGQITKKELKIPDVDADFSPTDRDKVMRFIVDSYGERNVVCLGLFQYIWAKGAIKDIGRALGIPFEKTNEMTKLLNDETIDEALNLGILDAYKNEYPDLFEYASKLSGLPKSYGMHPCFTGNTLVNTCSGLKQIKDVVVGDKVMTHLGNEKLVVKTMCHVGDHKQVIKTYGAFNIECTKNHPFYVRHRLKARQRIYSEPEWVEAENIVKSDMLCIPINNNSRIPKYKKLPTNKASFWWLVGRYIGDGWCEYYEQPRNEKRLIICCEKKTFHELNEILKRLEGLFEYRYEESRTTFKIHIKNEEFYEYVQRFGKYAHGKKMTNDIFDLPINLLKSFLDGYESADGYITKEGYTTIKTVSYELANGIMRCVEKVYHKYCTTHILEAKKEFIENRQVNSKQKYIISYNKIKTKNDKGFYDEKNNCIWIYVKSNISQEYKDTNFYNLSVLDDNTYTANGVAVHNCGKVVCMQDAVYYNALEYVPDEDVWVLQGDMHTADDLGLVKIDLLGLRTLDVIYDVLDMIGEDYNLIAPHKINLSDERVWNEFMNGNSLLIFQFESQGMRNMLKDMGCNSIDDLSAANALYRPGSKSYIPDYIARKKGLAPITYINDELEPILSNTYGIIVYQEQLIEIGKLAGLRNPDELRKATAKKKPKLMAKIEPELKDGLVARGWTRNQVNILWSDILAFAKYSFNKSHSQAYALTAYITMYLKVYYPVEFITAYVNSYNGKTNKIAEVLYEAKRLGVEYKFDYWKHIKGTTTCRDGIVYLGINTLKEFGSDAAVGLKEIGEKNVDNFIDLIKEFEANSHVDKSQFSAMIKLGMFSEYGKVVKLLKIYNLYDKVYNAKVINKSKLPEGVDEEIIKKYSRETPKQYRDINNEGLFNELCIAIEDKDASLKNRLKVELEYKGIIDYSNPKYKDIVFVLDMNTKYSPKVKLYFLEDGHIEVCKISKKIFVQHPLDIHNMVQIIEKKEKYKMEKIGDDFVANKNAYDTWLEKYIVR